MRPYGEHVQTPRKWCNKHDVCECGTCHEMFGSRRGPKALLKRHRHRQRVKARRLWRWTDEE